MHIDLIGLRGSGKSTVYKYLREKHGSLGREDRNSLDVGSWEAFKRYNSEFVEAFMEECDRFRDFRTGEPLPKHTLKNYKKEFCLYVAVKNLDRLFAWDKGVLEPLMHTVLHSSEDINSMMYRINLWAHLYPTPYQYWYVDSKDSFDRARARKRNYQWDRRTYDRMTERHLALVDVMFSLPYREEVPISNNRRLEDLYREVDACVSSLSR